MTTPVSPPLTAAATLSMSELVPDGVRWTFICVSVAAALTALIYTTLAETLPDKSAAAITPPIDACVPETFPETECLAEPATSEAVGTEAKESDDERELWLELLSDPLWRGLSLAGMGTRFGSCAKVASVPLIAASVLPGGATAAGSLLAAAGLSGLAGAPLGGLLSDRIGARSTAVLSGALSSVTLLLVPLALTAPLGDPIANGVAFSGLILVWSLGVAAQGPALTAVAQEASPRGAEATALALPKASGDAVFIVAPFMLGVITDMETVVGTECAVAGAFSLLGAIALQVLGGDGEERDSASRRQE